MVTALAHGPRALGDARPLDDADLRSVELRSVPHPSRLEAPITSLKGAGPKRAAAASELGLECVGDLLWHLPHGYRDRTALRQVGDLRIGEEATVLVEVRSARVRPVRRRGLRAIVEAQVADESGPMKAVWFNQAWIAERLVPGARALLHGKLDRSGFRVEAHEIVGAGEEADGLHTLGIVPVHPASEQLKPAALREWEAQAITQAGSAIEPLPAELRARLRFPSEADALRAAHFPQERDDAGAARRRLAFEELFLHQAALATRRGWRQSARPGVALDAPGELVE